MARNDFHSAIFVAGLENQRAQMFVDGGLAGSAERLAHHHLVVEASVLTDVDHQVVENILDVGVGGVDGYRNLLMGVVIVDIGDRKYIAAYQSGGLAYHEPGLQENGVGIVLAVNLKEIIARNGELHVGIRKHDVIMDIVGEGHPRIVPVVDVPEIEAFEIFRLDESRRFPVGIAVDELIAQI